jgi:hypothetical protein
LIAFPIDAVVGSPFCFFCVFPSPISTRCTWELLPRAPLHG